MYETSYSSMLFSANVSSLVSRRDDFHKQEIWATAKKTARCALGALTIILESPWIWRQSKACTRLPISAS